MSREKMIPPQPPTEETPWQRFEQAVKKIIAVPKAKVAAANPARSRQKSERKRS